MPHFSFLRSRQFLPIFIAQALGAFNDNFYRNAMAVWVTYRLAETMHMKAATMISVASAIFLLPFFLFSAVAGQLADTHAKHLLVQKLKLAECFLCVIAAISLFLGNPWLMLFSLFLLGTQAAIFGPVKYAILPELLPPHALLNGNALVEAGTFLAILTGTLLGGLLVLKPHGLWIVSVAMLAMSAVGYIAARYVPVITAPEQRARISWNIITSTVRVLRNALRVPALRLPVIGISWFWALGAVYLTQFPVFVKQVFGGNEEVVTLLIALFSAGIAFGAWLCGAVLHGRGMRSALVALAVFATDLWWGTHALHAGDGLIGAADFLSHPNAWRTMADVVALAVAGGVFVVPLYTRLQTNASADTRAQVIAANNIMNALFIVVIALITAVSYSAGFGVQDVFLGVAALSGLAALGSLFFTR